jgi:NAD(P)-dependent dehydrogenase (short-subunit alcohol dehydrogenase family)
MSTQRLSDRVIAITGASSGIGRAAAEQLAAEGAAVVLCARRADRLDDIVSRIVTKGGRALAVRSDVTKFEDMRLLVARAVESYGQLDVMICNAGIGFHDAFDRTPEPVMRRLVDVNLMGTFYAAHAAIEHFLPRRRGHVIAVSSIVGRRGMAGSAVYSATKAAQIGFIEALRAEFAGTGLAASLVYPVSTTTEFHEAILRDFGHRVHGLGPSQSADVVARAIVDCVVSPKAEVYPFPKAWWLAVLSVIAPRRADQVVQKWGRRVER